MIEPTQYAAPPSIPVYSVPTDVPQVPSTCYHNLFLVLYSSHRSSKKLQYKVVTHNSTGWVHLDRTQVKELIYGWVKLPTVDLL